MRKNRVIEQNRCYHLISRPAHRAFFLDDEEKDRAVALMRRVEEFSGVVVLAKSSFVRRMWNSAEFMRTFKQHFTMSFNGRREHSGTMFKGRYHERNHPAERPTMWRTSAYIDINAWEAGIAERPEDYRWCSFAAAAQGNRKARAGYAFMYGGGEWRVIRECHEKSMLEAMGEVLKTREAKKEEGRSGRDAAPVRSKADPKLAMPGKVELGLARGSEKTARRILELLAGGPMSPSALREAVGIKSRIHFSRYYMTPLIEKGLVARTDPENPMSPRQEYKLA